MKSNEIAWPDPMIGRKEDPMVETGEALHIPGFHKNQFCCNDIPYYICLPNCTIL